MGVGGWGWGCSAPPNYDHRGNFAEEVVECPSRRMADSSTIYTFTNSLVSQPSEHGLTPRSVWSLGERPQSSMTSPLHESFHMGNFSLLPPRLGHAVVADVPNQLFCCSCWMKFLQISASARCVFFSPGVGWWWWGGGGSAFVSFNTSTAFSA